MYAHGVGIHSTMQREHPTFGTRSHDSGPLAGGLPAALIRASAAGLALSICAATAASAPGLPTPALRPWASRRLQCDGPWRPQGDWRLSNTKA